MFLIKILNTQQHQHRSSHKRAIYVRTHEGTHFKLFTQFVIANAELQWTFVCLFVRSTVVVAEFYDQRNWFLVIHSY